jgi:asparagine synthase (glutamine-hydrolysing)
MCGISGIFSLTNPLSEVDISRVEEMNLLLKHRGPNDQGLFTSEKCILGQTRLSIIDLSKDGHQPFYSEDRKYVLIFNGEIYNYIELRNDLEMLGVKFNTKTDTEVLLKSYLQWGLESFHKFNGMFVFALYDTQNHEILLVRDRFGVKPLYYIQSETEIIFSSEILPLWKTSKVRLLPNEQIIFDFLAYNRTNHTEYTFFEGIKKLPHGQFITINSNSYKKEKWYDLRLNVKKPFESKDELKAALCSAIEIRMRSDVPVGSSLSGGVDSSSIVSLLMERFKFNEFHSFSAVYEENHRANEKEFIVSLSQFTISMHFTYPSSESLLSDMKNFIFTMNEPVPSTSIYAYLKVYELAKPNVTVMLDGQGADECLGGYGYFRGFYYKDLLKKFRLIRLLREILLELYYLRSNEGILAFIFFLAPAFLKDFLIRRKINYLGIKLKRKKSSSVITKFLWNAKSLKDALIAHFEYKLEHLLAWGDKTSMANSIEVRYPFLDYRFVERTIGMDGSKLFRDGYNKHILRDAVKGIVPDKILTRRQKIGFETPEDEWFRTQPFQKIILEILNSESFSRRGYINPDKAKVLYNDHLARKRNISGEIWKWINLELWSREFIDCQVVYV